MSDHELGELRQVLRQFGANEATQETVRAMAGEILAKNKTTLLDVSVDKKTNAFFAVFWDISSKKAEGALKLEAITASYKSPLPIADKSFDGIHVKTMERQMGEVNWSGFSNAKEAADNIWDRNLDKQIGSILMRLTALSMHPNPQAREIAKRLEYNFFAFTAMEVYAVSDIAETKQKNLRSIEIDPEGPMAINVHQARNILEGRFVRPLLRDGSKGQIDERWLGVDLSGRNNMGLLTLKYLEGSQGFDLPMTMREAMIENPEAMARNYKVLQQLSEGYAVMLPIKKGEVRGSRIFYADPPNWRLSIDQDKTERAGLYKQAGIERSVSGPGDQSPKEGRSRRP